MSPIKRMTSAFSSAGDRSSRVPGGDMPLQNLKSLYAESPRPSDLHPSRFPMPPTAAASKTSAARTFAPITNTVDNRLVAIPWFIHAGLLYYRRDLLEKHGCRVPETWEELTETAYIVMQSERQERERECQERQRQEHGRECQAGTDRMWGYVFQGHTYEGLTVNALEWLDSHNAGP